MIRGKIRGLVMLAMALVPCLVFGQPDNPPGAPIHGVAILLVAGISFGILNLRKKSKQ